MVRKGGPIDPIEGYRSQLSKAFEKYGVVVGYLYGSQVNGNAGALSDVDIAVLFARGIEASERFHRLLGLMSDLANVFQRDDVSVLDLNEGTPLLNNNVRLHGRVIYCADERARAEFVLRALQQFEDTQQLRYEQNRYLREKIEQGLYGQAIPIARAR
jgi:predicted nucleotidyltransferase